MYKNALLRLCFLSDELIRLDITPLPSDMNNAQNAIDAFLALPQCSPVFRPVPPFPAALHTFPFALGIFRAPVGYIYVIAVSELQVYRNARP